MIQPDLSRRAMLTVTAAGVALAACSPKSSATPGNQKSADDKPATGTGINPSNGDDPNVGFPTGVAYAPKYMTLVRITSKGSWDISTNHASFPAPVASSPADPDLDMNNRLKAAIEIFKKFTGGNASKRFGELNLPGIIKRNQGKFDAIDFDDFNFGHQHDIYIWFDTAAVALHKTAAGKAHLIEMTSYRADGTATDPNKSFYAQDVSANVQANLKGSMILVRNYLCDKDGKPLRNADDTPANLNSEFKYSMNIFFELIRKNSKNLIVILDPSTGNGTGYDPFVGL